MTTVIPAVLAEVLDVAPETDAFEVEVGALTDLVSVTTVPPTTLVSTSSEAAAWGCVV